MKHLELLRDLGHMLGNNHAQYVEAVRASIPHVAAGCAVTRDYLVAVTNLDLKEEELQLLTRVIKGGSALQACAFLAAGLRLRRSIEDKSEQDSLKSKRERLLLSLLWPESEGIEHGSWVAAGLALTRPPASPP